MEEMEIKVFNTFCDEGFYKLVELLADKFEREELQEKEVKND